MSSTDALFSSPAHSARRVPWLRPADERAARLRQQRVLHTLEERMQSPVAGPQAAAAAVQRVYAAERVFHHRLELWRFDYSAGVSLAQLSADLREVIRAYGLWRWLFDRLFSRRSPSTTVQAPGNLTDAGHYRDFLQLLALCRLFGLEDRIPALIEPQLHRAGMDVLLAALAHLPLTDASGTPRWPDAPPALRVLQRALLAPNPEGDRQEVEAYCTALREAARQANRYAAGAGSSVTPATDWAFEAAALCMRGTAGMAAEYWPSDLAWVGSGAWVAPSTRRRSTDPQPAVTRSADAFPLQTNVKPSGTTGRRIAAAVAASLALGDTARAMAPAIEVAPPALSVERGLASWYGPGFQERPTASGERYDMHLLTAAHRTLPLPSYVHVRNLRNNRQAVVVVNDRGPYIDGRVLDVSLAAAEQLEMVEPGVVEVEITLLTAEQVAYWAQARPADSPVAMAPRVVAADVPYLGGLAALAGVQTKTAQADRPAALPTIAVVDPQPALRAAVDPDGVSRAKPSRAAGVLLAAHAGGLAGLSGDAQAVASASAQRDESSSSEPVREPAAEAIPDAPTASDEPVLSFAAYRPEAAVPTEPAAPIVCATPAIPVQAIAVSPPPTRVKAAAPRRKAPTTLPAAARRTTDDPVATRPMARPTPPSKTPPAFARAATARPTAAAPRHAEPPTSLLARVEALGLRGWRGLIGALGFGG